MVLRFLMIGLCTACVVMLAALEPLRIEVVRPVPAADRATPVSVVDVAHGVAPDDLVALLHLRPGEHLSAINDQPLADASEDASLAALAPHAGEYLDLTVASETAERRVLVLMH
jgi:hypothetical protein